MKFKDTIKEDKKEDLKFGELFEKELTVDEFIDSLEKHITKLFPKSYVVVQLSKKLGKSIYVKFTIGDKNQWSNGIIQNDPCGHAFHIWGKGRDQDVINEDGSFNQSLEVTGGGSLSVKPPEDSYLAYGSVKTSFRKKSGSPDKILKHLVTFFTKLKTIIKDNKDNFTDEDKLVVKKNI